MASKFFAKNQDVDLYHPRTRLFLSSGGQPIEKIQCKHLKKYLKINITAYDFRRSLVTYCMDHLDDKIRLSESSVLRHSTKTASAYYYQKHSDNVCYVNQSYASDQGLRRAEAESVVKRLGQLFAQAVDDNWDLNQKRSDRQFEYEQVIQPICYHNS